MLVDADLVELEEAAGGLGDHVEELRHLRPASPPPHDLLMTWRLPLLVTVVSVLATFNRSGVTRQRRLLDTRYLLSTSLPVSRQGPDRS